MNIKSIGSKIKGNPTMVDGTVYSMLIICSISHFLNDMIQSIIPSIYPIVKDKFGPLEKVCGYRSTIKILFCPFIKLNNG